jgi:hypothetical protein
LTILEQAVNPQHNQNQKKVVFNVILGNEDEEEV